MRAKCTVASSLLWCSLKRVGVVQFSCRAGQLFGEGGEKVQDCGALVECGDDSYSIGCRVSHCEFSY
jgi:hypothetical protein